MTDGGDRLHDPNAASAAIACAAPWLARPAPVAPPPGARERRALPAPIAAWAGGVAALANRVEFRRRVEQCLGAIERASHAMLCVSLDGLGAVCARHGRAAGDELLRQALARMLRGIRAADVAGRGGEDTLGCLLASACARDAVAIAERMRTTLLAPYRIGSLELKPRVSIGIALSPRDGATPEILLKHADDAVYRARDAGGVALFDRRIDS